MKKIFLIAFLITSIISQSTFAQNNNSTTTSALLTSYYGLKDALVAGNSADANMHASRIVEAARAIDSSKIKGDTYDEIIVDANHISKSKDINHQREHFARLSTNMFTVAKSIKLSDQPIYYDFCPMKKSYWLSSNLSIKNPYYGNQMLSCGKISETLR